MNNPGEKRLFELQEEYVNRLRFLYESLGEVISKRSESLSQEQFVQADVLAGRFARLSNQIEGDPARVDPQDIDRLAADLSEFLTNVAKGEIKDE